MYEIRNFYKELEAASRLATEERWLYEQMRLKNTGGYQLSSGSMISNGAERKINESLDPNKGRVSIFSPDKPRRVAAEKPGSAPLPPPIELDDDSVMDDFPALDKGKGPEKPKKPKPPSTDPEEILRDLDVVPTQLDGKAPGYSKAFLTIKQGSLTWGLSRQGFSIAVKDNMSLLRAPNGNLYPMTTGLMLLLTQSGPKGIIVLKENAAKIHVDDVRNYVEIFNDLPAPAKPNKPRQDEDYSDSKNHITYIGSIVKAYRTVGNQINQFNPYRDANIGYGIRPSRTRTIKKGKGIAANQYRSANDIQKRIAVLKGEIQAGNNSKRIFQELLELINISSKR